LRFCAACNVADAADFRLAVDHGVEADALAVFLAHAARLAEVDVAGQLADDQDVQAGNDLRLQCRGIGQFRVENGRAQVGEQVQILADAEQAALRAFFTRQAVPLRATDRTEQTASASRASFALLPDRGCRWHPPPPPSKASSISNLRSSAFRTRTASAVISGPMPSPGRTQIFMVFLNQENSHGCSTRRLASNSLIFSA
jgi:hypothetical protein